LQHLRSMREDLRRNPEPPLKKRNLSLKFDLVPGTISELQVTSEVIVSLRLLSGFLAIIFPALAAQAASFDAPTFKKTVDLGPSTAGPGARAKVTCYFFPHFMVKEVDRGEKGAERLAIVPGKAKVHTCSRLREEGEKEVNSDDWTGYFKGVKGDLVFFDADDGWNGGIGFAIYDSRTGNKIFDDTALGPLEFADTQDKTVVVRYTRVADGGCAVPKEAAACWDAIKKKLTLDAVGAPDCKADYEKSAEAIAKGRCQAQNAASEKCLDKELPLARTQAAGSTSVIVYPVELVLGPSPTVRPVAGDIRCWPAD